jgi:hypothetical protein
MVEHKMALLQMICSCQLSAMVLAASEPDVIHLVQQFICCQQTNSSLQQVQKHSD